MPIHVSPYKPEHRSGARVALCGKRRSAGNALQAGLALGLLADRLALLDALGLGLCTGR